MARNPKIKNEDRLTVGEFKRIIDGLDDDCMVTIMHNDSEVVYGDNKIWLRKKNDSPKEFIMFFNDPE